MVGFLVFLQTFMIFLFFLTLLNVYNIGVLELVLGFLWCVCFEEEIYLKILVKHGK